MPRTIAILIQINLLFSFLNAQEFTLATDTIQKLDEVIIKANTILGNKYVAKNRTGRSEEGRVGKEGRIGGRSRWSPDH